MTFRREEGRGMEFDNVRALLALLVVIIAFLLLFLFSKKEERERLDEETKRRRGIRYIVFDAVIVSLLLVMTFIPNVGFIAVGPFSLTLLHLPVLLGASLFGWKRGLVYGTVFGLLSWLKSLYGANTVFDVAFQKIYVSVPPRMLFGLAIGLLSTFLPKIKNEKGRTVYLAIGCFMATCLHTVMVFLDLFVVEPWVYSWLFSDNVAIEGTGITILGFLGLAMVMEASLGAILTPILNRVLFKAVPTLHSKELALGHSHH